MEGWRHKDVHSLEFVGWRRVYMQVRYIYTGAIFLAFKIVELQQNKPW